MRKCLVSVAALSLGCFLSLPPGAHAQALIGGNDMGGQIGNYLQKFRSIRARGEQVIVDGNCLSACTLVLGIISSKKLCVERSARLGFHAAWTPDETGKPRTSAIGTQALLDTYPADIRRIIARRGGLRPKMFYVHGYELSARYRRGCEKITVARALSGPHARKKKESFARALK